MGISEDLKAALCPKPCKGPITTSQHRLMPDGRVWTAGTDGPTSEDALHELRIELYPPPYMFATGRPVITEDTGFGKFLPTGDGLFAFRTMDDVLAAIDAIESDYPRHCRAAREIAESHFGAERVVGSLMSRAGL